MRVLAPLLTLTMALLCILGSDRSGVGVGVMASRLPMPRPALVATDDQAHTHVETPSSAPPWPITSYPDRVGTTTILDLLSNSSEHRILVRLLQRSRLVPTINRLQHRGTNLTFLAPIDTAWPVALQDAFGNNNDNEQRQMAALAKMLHTTESKYVYDDLANLLLYHLVNRSLLDNIYDHPSSSPKQLEATLYIPHVQPWETSQRLSGEPLLSGQQVIFVDYSDKMTFGWSYGTNSSSNNTSLVSRTAQGLYGLNCTKGLVIAIDAPLERPPSLSTLFRTHPKLTSLSRLIELGVGRFPFPVPLDGRDVTAFLPSDQALVPNPDSSSPMLTADESAWLANPSDALAANDRAKLVAWHIAADEHVLYRPSHASKQDITMTLGGSYVLDPHEEQLGHAPILEESILVENGVVHLLGAALSPYLAPPAKSLLPMNMHRVLTARGAGQFASLLRSNGLGWAVDQPAWPTLEDPSDPSDPTNASHDDSVPDRLTILGVTDDFLTGMVLPPDGSISEAQPDAHQRSMKALKDTLDDQLNYHILPGGWGLLNLTDPGMQMTSTNWLKHRYLLPTQLYPRGLGGRRQRLDVRVLIPLDGDHDDDDDDDDDDDGDEPDVGHYGLRIQEQLKKQSFVRAPVQLAFGGRSPLDLEPLVIGARGDVLWFLRGAIKPPKDVFNVLLSVGAGNLGDRTGRTDVQSSEGGVALFASWLSATEKTRTLLERGQNITGLIPRDEALSTQRLGKLLLNSITRSSYKLARVTESAFIHDVVYTEDFPSPPSQNDPEAPSRSGLQVPLGAMDQEQSSFPVYHTLEGGKITLGAYKNRKNDGVNLFATTPESGPDVLSVLRGKHDLLTDTGALHLVDSLLFPADLEITIADLLLSSDLSEMYELVSQTRFAHILGAGPNLLVNDTTLHEPKPYVLLAPKPDAFSPKLLAGLRNDSVAREAFVARHLIKLPGATDDCSQQGTDNSPDAEVPARPKSWLQSWLPSILPKYRGPPWPPAAPGPAPRTNPLQSFTPLDFSDGLVWGTCANNRLNQVALRINPPADAQTRASNGDTYLIGINNAYGSATGKGHSAQILQHGVQVPFRTGAPISLYDHDEPGSILSGGVLLIDSVLMYNPLWDTPQQHRTAWLVTVLAIGGAAYALYKLVQLFEEHRRARQLVDPLDGEEE